MIETGGFPQISAHKGPVGRAVTRFYEAFNDLVSPYVKRVSILANSSHLRRKRYQAEDASL